jgi:hypothetical protein
VKEFTQELGKMGTVAGGAKGKLGEMTKAFTDLTLQFNQMTEAEKRGQFGKALSAGLDELKQRIISTKKELADINNSLNGGGAPSADGLFGGGKLDGMLQVLGGNLMTKGVSVLAGFASEMGDMVKQGIELARQGEGIRIAFERLNKPGLLDNLREATHGTLTNLELMKAAVQFNDFKLPLEELGTMLAFAQQKAKDTGQSVDYMAQSIVTGLGRKSVMILDNLGLSAAEIKEKMKETGDMTKAVGEIIREQMSKAGDYVETAADRATKANVELENAMTRLGETFQPLTDAANSMWNDIKIGALDLLNNAIRPLINAFTEAGRARALYENQGGDARVNRQLGRLKGVQTDSYRQGTYKAQLRNYDTQIASHEQYLKDYKAWQSDNTNVGAYDRMQKFKQQTGLEWVSDVQAHLDAFKKMRSEYVQGAKAILEGNPVPSPTSTTTTTPTGGASGNTFDASKIAFTGGEGFKAQTPAFEPMMNTIDFMAGLRKEMGMDGEKTRDWGKELGQVFADYVADPDKEKRDKANKTDKDLVKNLSTLTSGISTLTSGIKGLGIDLPKEVDDVIGIITSLTSIIQGVQTIISIFGNTAMAANTAAIIANTAALTANTATNLLPFAHGGIVPHAANGYYVPGTHASGDVTPILANAGELVLNKSSQNNLANELKGAEALVQTLDRYQTSIMRGSQIGSDAVSMGAGILGNLRLSAEVSAEQIYFILKNNGMRTGRGEFVTTNFR